MQANAHSTDLKRKIPATGLASPTMTSDLVTDDGFTKVQKRKKHKGDKQKHRPQFQYDTSYFRQGKKIGIAHIRDLSLFIAADANRPSWIVVDNPSLVSHTVVVLVPGLLPTHLGIAPLPPVACLPFQTTPSPFAETTDTDATLRVPTIPKLFAYGCPTRAPGDNRRLHSVLSSMTQCPLPEAIKRKRGAEHTRLIELAKKGGAQSSPLLYICTPHQMAANGYRLPSYVEIADEPFVPGDLPDSLAEVFKTRKAMGTLDVTMDGLSVPPGPRPIELDDQGRRRRGNVREDEGWVETPQATGPPPDGKYPVLAIDCEMVLSADGQELARVSVVDESGKNVFDELVNPPTPVVDYLTQFSGMTAKRMAHATHTLESIQEALVTGPEPLITPHTILLGHSLDCDLGVLKIRHPLVIDTTVIYRHPRGPPFKSALKWLTQRWLQRAIQGGATGHDSEEDARACVDLLQMKLMHGPDFGDPNSDAESIFERLGRYKPSSSASGRRSLVADHGNPASWYGSKATKAVACTDDDEVVDAVVNGIADHEYVFARLCELSNVQNWNSNSHSGSDIDLSPPSDEDLEAALARFDERLARLHAGLPHNTALIMATGHSDPRPMLHLAQRRTRWERAHRADPEQKVEKWTTADDRDLEMRVAEAREGMAFFCVK